MQKGWIRDWDGSNDAYWAAFNASKTAGGDYRDNKRAGRKAVSDFRKGFTAALMDSESGSTTLLQLDWGAPVAYPNFSFFAGQRTELTVQTVNGPVSGWVDHGSVAVHAFVRRTGSIDDSIAEPKDLKIALRKGPSSSDDKSLDLLWGDLLQVTGKQGNWARVAARGRLGWVRLDELSLAGDESPLLEVYFIDVGQGDGVLLRSPDGRHMLVDGGLPRSYQQTGKNAADFVDWKFFHEYGDLDIRIDAMVASHCDKDHYGGLDDLVSTSKKARAELDARSVKIDALYHAGLSYWQLDAQEEALFPEAPSADKWLGPTTPWTGSGLDAQDSFVGKDSKPGQVFRRLLGDENEVADVIQTSNQPNLHGDWRKFFDRSLKAGATTIRALGVGFDQAATPAHVPAWGPGAAVEARILAPLTLDGPDGPALPDFESTSQNTNGHSILLRLDYGKARIMLTGDLNKNSMHYILRGYPGPLRDELKCDVAKGCHHGSHDISVQFLAEMKAGATVISSGDSEGYGHPRPEVVGASAATGHVEIDINSDQLITPLIYSTEVERGVSLGAAKLLNFSRYPTGSPVGSDEMDGTMFPRAYSGSDQAIKDLQKANRDCDTGAEFEYTYFKGVWTRKTGKRSIENLRILDRVTYGLVNVRTDGELIMCATQTDSAQGWVIHAFKSRF